MKKPLKIALITVVSLLTVLIITVSVLIWIVFTPAKLTPIVRDQTQKYISCQSEIGEVELTFFSTFPQFGLKINGFNLINKVEAEVTDTLLKSQTVVAKLDFDALWNRNELILNDIRLENVALNAYVSAEGKANFDVFISDTTDTSSFKNPFSKIDLRDLTLKNANVSYVDLSADMRAKLNALNGKFSFDMAGDDLTAQLEASSPEVSYYMDSIDYLKNADVKLNVPFHYNFNKSLLTLDAAKLVLNGLAAEVNGTVDNSSVNGDVITDLHFTTEKYQLKPLLAMIPKVYTTSLEGMTMDGLVNTKGTVKGVYNPNSMPVIDINAELGKGTFEYVDLPYKLREILGNADVHIELNDEMASKVIINKVKAKTGESNVEVKGLVNYILADDMLIDLDMIMKLNLPELEPMLPEDMGIKLNGIASGSGNIKFMLSDAVNMAVEKMNITGNFDVADLGIVYDSLSMYSDKARLNLKMPNKNPLAKFMNAGLWCDKLRVHQGKNTAATIYNTNMLAEISNMMETYKMNTLLCDFDFGQMSASMDNIVANLEKSKGKLALDMNFSDSVAVPKVDCDFDVQSLVATMDTMSLKMQYPKGKFKMHGNAAHPDQMVIDLLLNSANTAARMGSQKITAQELAVNANVIQNDKASSTILQWIPTGFISMQQGKVTADGLKADIEIPILQFDFNEDEYIIKNSKFIVDNSDFKLVGKLWNVSDYLNDKGLLKGDFDFISNTTDVYRLMELTNGLGVEDSSAVVVANENNSTNAVVSTEEPTSTGPYMVPKGMDLKLHAKVDKALLGFDSALNVLGDLYVKDGLLVLEDMRFRTSASKIQLTAMYKTPRKNHLFIGMDFHMMETEIEEMLTMIPDIDSIMPMMRSFKGKGEFHIAVESYMDSLYNFKPSTLRGVASVKGENLVLMDGQKFSEIAKTLMFSKKTENKVDSLSAEISIFKGEVDVYPFLIVMDKYKAVVAGRHNLNMSFDYHISVTESPLPIKLGVDVKGTMDKMKITPVPCKYANLYRPVQRREIDTKQLEIRKMIRDALKKEVVKQ